MKILSLAILAVAASLSLSAGAHADVLPDGNGGANCKNTAQHPGSCTLLAATCAGTYTDAGGGYGKCSKVKINRTSQSIKAKIN